MAKAPKKLDELFHDTLKDIYYAEKKILSALPKMAKAAHNQELKAAFEKHYRETEGHVERLEQVFATIKQKPQGKTCAAIVGITDEGAEIMEEYKGSPALDAGLLAAAGCKRMDTNRTAGYSREHPFQTAHPRLTGIQTLTAERYDNRHGARGN